MGEAKNRKNEIKNLKMNGAKCNNFRLIALKFEDSITKKYVSSTVVIINDKNEIEMEQKGLVLNLLKERVELLSKVVDMNNGKECQVTVALDKVFPMSKIDEIRNGIKRFCHAA